MRSKRVGRRRVEQSGAPKRIEIPRDLELDLFESSLERSRGRRRWIFARRRRRRRGVAAAIAAATFIAAAGLVAYEVARREGAPASAKPGGERIERTERTVAPAEPRRPRATFPEAGAIQSAWSYARGRAGLVSVAVIDSRGRMHGFDGERAYPSASLSKALLLAAELRRLEAAGAALDTSTRELLTRMITVSDNDAADAIYYRVGDAALHDVAHDAGMQSFSVAGYWAEAQITAPDMTRFMWNLDDVFAGPNREFALGLLGSIASSQRWGIPAGAGAGWNVRFKGGWRPSDSGSLVHQAAELRRDGERLAIAVLSDAQPSHEYGTETLRGIADRLVGRMSSEPWDGRWR